MEIKTTILTADVPTLNGTIYPKEALENAIKVFNERTNPLICENSFSAVNSGIVDLTKASHIIKNVELIENDLVVTIDLLDTPNGKVVKTLVDAGCVDVRAGGTCTFRSNNNGTTTVNADYVLTSTVFVDGTGEVFPVNE